MIHSSNITEGVVDGEDIHNEFRGGIIEYVVETDQMIQYTQACNQLRYMLVKISDEWKEILYRHDEHLENTENVDYYDDGDEGDIPGKTYVEHTTPDKFYHQH